MSQPSQQEIAAMLERMENAAAEDHRQAGNHGAAAKHEQCATHARNVKNRSQQ